MFEDVCGFSVWKLPAGLKRHVPVYNLFDKIKDFLFLSDD